MTPAVAEAIRSAQLGSRIWIYANYHCNLTCSYCLTESGPGVQRRLLDRDDRRGRADTAPRSATAGWTRICW